MECLEAIRHRSYAIAVKRRQWRTWCWRIVLLWSDRRRGPIARRSGIKRRNNWIRLSAAQWNLRRNHLDYSLLYARKLAHVDGRPKRALRHVGDGARRRFLWLRNHAVQFH